MNPDALKIREMFVFAVGQVPPDQWDAYLDQACAGRQDLRGEVSALLQAHRQAASFLGRPAADVAAVLKPGPSAEPPAPHAGPIDQETWQRIDPFVRRFEEAWQSSTPPNIDDFLPQHGPDHLAVLRELVKVDIERRQKAGTP